jgi:hypothetical protein
MGFCCLEENQLVSIPEPFTAAALTAGVITNIAADILEHHAQALEGTLVGRMLKWAGLIEPNFDDRLRDTLSKALSLYFEAHPQYKLTGITTFFRDPAVARQIGGYILDRKSIDKDQIQQAFYRHLGSAGITRVLIQQCGLELECIVPDFLECYRRVLGEQLSVPQMAILLEIVDQTDTVIAEMRASEERLATVVQQVASRVNAQTEKLESIDASLQAIKQHLGLDRPQTVIIEEIKVALDAAPRGPMFEHGGLCSGYLLRPMPDRYLVAQEFTPDRDDLRDALAAALAEFDVQPVSADDFLWSGHILCKISALIQGTPFGVYQLTVTQNRNVYLELGIAMGLSRPFVLVKDKDAKVSPLAQGLDYYSIDSYLELRYELGGKVRPFLADIASYRPQELPRPGSQRTAVIAHGDLEVIDFCVPMAKMIAKHKLTPVILGDPTGKLAGFLEGIPHHITGSTGRMRLDETVAAIQAARLGVYRIEKSAAPDTFLALGVSMGLNRPGLLIHRADRDLPSDVKGLNALEFASFSGLEESFPERLGHLLRRYS